MTRRTSTTPPKEQGNASNHERSQQYPTVFFPREIKSLKDAKALREALSMFQKLQQVAAAPSAGETNLDPSSSCSSASRMSLSMSKFSPSPLLLSSMQRLLDIEEEKERLESKSNMVSTFAPCSSRNNTTAQMLTIRRNFTGGRARFSKFHNLNTMSTVTMSNNINVMTTPGFDSARSKQQQERQRRRRLPIQERNTIELNTNEAKPILKCQKSVLFTQYNEDNEKKMTCPPFRISPDVPPPPMSPQQQGCKEEENEVLQQSGNDDFTFHSQSSLPSVP
jgi:hypothetical protein